MNVDFLNELNDSQRAAVEYCDGPSLVVAGAGSGKTRVLTYKIAYLLHSGLPPYNVLALTFTNKAAKEMKQRISTLVGGEPASQLWMGTFHSVFSHILRKEASHIGFSSNFTIYDAADSRSLLKSIIKENELDDKIYKPATVASRISKAKDLLVFPDDYGHNMQMCASDSASKMPRLVDIYKEYFTRCKKSNVMDFDDLLLYTYSLFESCPDVLRKYEEKFRYVLVDEYQDTNYVQHKIVLQLTQRSQRVCVVGDDAQSIYGFRGANIDNILNFSNIYQSAKTFKLERNYRSTQHIVAAANSLISHNVEQIKKKVFSKNDAGELICLHKACSDTEEAMIVCNEISRLQRAEHCAYSDFAVLYRTNSQSRIFEETMRKRNIAYRIYGGLSFYQRKEIKDVISYFRIISNTDDDEAFRRVVNYPARGIGDTTVSRMVEYAHSSGISLWTAISDEHVGHIGVNNGAIKKLMQFRMLIENFRTHLTVEDAYTLGVRVINESGIKNAIYSDSTPENISRQENIGEFINGMQNFVGTRREEGYASQVSLPDFLQDVSLLTDLDNDKDSDAPKVTLMTIHSAKGLEFPTVFIVGVEENIFPSPMCLNSPRQIEEERRLFYVAITRAERHCIITCAERRHRYGNVEYDSPSRFLRDIDSDLISEAEDNMDFMPKKPMSSPFSHPLAGNSKPYTSSSFSSASSFKSASSSPSSGASASMSRYKPLRPSVRQSPSAPSASQNTAQSMLQEGCIIEHERFGLGSVLRVEGSGENAKATVQFKNTGVKQLLLKFARFKIIQ